MKTLKSLLFTLVWLLNASAQEVANELVIQLPKVVETPKVEAIVPKVVNAEGATSQTNEEILKELMREKVVIFSDHVAPVAEEIANDANTSIEVGDIDKGRVTAYLHTASMTLEDLKKKLQAAGFEVLHTYALDKDGTLSSVVFTNKALLANASKTQRGFAANLRATLDAKNNLVSITNPIYHLRAFMQDEYDQNLSKATLASLRQSFGNLKNSDEVLKFAVLERFEFMEGMPKYADMKVIAKDENAKLLQQAKNSNKVLFEQKLENGSTLLGVQLSNRTNKFLDKIGTQNAGLLPYPVLIEHGEAKILDPKYYIALMYPMLKMSQFMTISTVPGAIQKDIDKLFR
jgi:hypothetical protein